MRILLITNEVPYPPISGVRLRNYHLVRRIAEHHEVSLAAHLYKQEDADGVGHLQEFCQRVVTGWLRPLPIYPHVPALVRFALAGIPLELEFFYSQELAQQIRALAADNDFDVVHIEESILAPYLGLFPAGRCKRLLTFHNVGFVQVPRMAQFALTWKMKWRLRLFGAHLRWWEPRYAARFDRCIAVSDGERHVLLAANPRLHVDVVPNGIDTKACQPIPMNGGSPAVLFIGHMGYAPCVDAARYLVTDILPHIRHTIPDAEVWLVGTDPADAVTRLHGNGVHVTGRVSDVRPYYERCAAAVVPLRAGGGTRLKILEAMAFNRPVVSTTIGSEGLEVVDGEHLLTADDAAGFASQVVRTIRDRPLSARLAANGRQLVVSRYDWDMIAARQLRIYNEITQ
jgi:polysaccharide biosynthesis protein PslH